MMLDFIVGLDKSLFVLINLHWTAGWADQFFPFITDLHKLVWFKALFIPALILFFIWKKGLKKGLIVFVFCLLSVGASDGIGNWVFKKNFERPRPPNTQGLQVTVRAPFGGYSFISNHSANMFSLASYTSSLFPAASIPFYMIATLIAYSRVYNGVHFPSDVIVGGILGLLIGLTFSILCKKILKKIDTHEAKIK